MVCEPTTVYHEGPGQRLAHLAALIAAGRGSPITTLGTSDLLVRDARGERQRIMQADQIVYLHPVEDAPRGAAVEVGADHLPDVVLEVDYSTGRAARQAWLVRGLGLPGSVGRGARRRIAEPVAAPPVRPDHSPARPRRLPRGGGEHGVPGLDGSGDPRRAQRAAAVRGDQRGADPVGRALGGAEGTVPEDDPWLREQRREAAAEATLEATRGAVMQVLRARGIAVPEHFAAGLTDASPSDLVDAALACRDAADFLARVTPSGRSRT